MTPILRHTFNVTYLTLLQMTIIIDIFADDFIAVRVQ